MKRKIFISLNLPKQTKKRLSKAIGEWDDLPVKWTKEDNLHITLLFLGFVDDDAAFEISEKVAFAVKDFEIFDIEFDSIGLGPDENDPKLIWLIGKENKELLALIEKLEKELGIFTRAKKGFRPHITLGRIRKQKWDDLPEKPKVSKGLPLIVTAESVDVMASDFEGGSTEYAMVESCPLQ